LDGCDPIYFKRKFIAMKDVQDYKKFDIIPQYRDYAQELEHDFEVQKRMLEFEENRSRRGTT
jgi:hypothetical protein